MVDCISISDMLKRLLGAYQRERYPEGTVTDDEDALAECSGDEFGETVSVDSENMNRSTEPVVDVVDAKQKIEEESDESDDEIKELFEKKKQLELEKETLSDARKRRQLAREKRKQQLRKDVEALTNEVVQLGMKYKKEKKY